MQVIVDAAGRDGGAGRGLIVVDVGIHLSWVSLCDSLVSFEGALGGKVADDEGVLHGSGGFVMVVAIYRGE